MRRKDRQITDIKEIEKIIGRADVCRIAFACDNIPYIVTMNFGYTGGSRPCFYFHCAREGRKLEMIKMNNYVCFGLDTDHSLYNEGKNGCDWGMSYSSVVGYGNISEVADNESRVRALDTIMSHYTDIKGFSYDPAVLKNTMILELEIREMTGKRK